MFNIIVKETKEFLRDKTNLFFFFLFPVLLIFLLGSLLGSMDKAEETIGTIQIQYQMDSVSEYHVMAIQSFIKEINKDNSQIQFEETEDLEVAKQLAGDNEIAAAVAFTGDPLEIRIFEGTNATKNRAIGAVFHSFAQTDQAIYTVMSTNPQAVSNLGTDQEEYLEQKDLGIQRTMIDYYAISMLAMICFMSVLVGAGAFVGERQSRTINRLIISPQNRVYLFLQKILGMVPQVVMQILVIMIISVLVFHAHYAVTLQANLYLFLMFFVLTLSMISVGAAIGMVIKANPMVVIMPVLWIMMFLGGTYSKELYLKGITDAMPIYRIQQAAFDITMFGRYGKGNVVIIISMLIMLAALCLGSYLFSRKEEER